MFLGKLGGRPLFEKTDGLAAPGAAREKLLHKAVAAVTGVTVLLTGSSWADGFQQPLSADFVADQTAALAKSADNWVRNQIDPGHPLADSSDPSIRARLSWNSLEQEMALPGRPGMFLDDNQRPVVATVWPQGQTLAAALDLAAVTRDYRQANAILASLEQYQLEGAYNPGVFRGLPDKHRLLDDNLWLGLDFLQAYAQTGDRVYLEKAAGLYDFLEANRHPGGGLHWGEAETPPSRNAVSNLPAVEYGIRLYQATHDPKYLAMAKDSDAFVEKYLRSPAGLIWDNVSDAGNVDRTLYSYNQGTAVRADVLLFQQTHEQKYLDRATATAKAAVEYYGQQDRLWKQPPVFNAIFFRSLLALDVVAPNPAYRGALAGYLERAWTQARSPSGLFQGGGIGQYQKGGMQTLDQAAFIQMFALQAMTPTQISAVG